MKKPGDRISIDSLRPGAHQRTGEIVEVVGDPGHEHYRVRWDDGGESIFYPAHAEPEEADSRPADAGPVASEEPPTVREPKRHEFRAEPGDRLVIHGHYLGEPERDAEILETRGQDGGPPFLVRWQDTGEEVLLWPSSDAHVEHVRHGQ